MTDKVGRSSDLPTEERYSAAVWSYLLAAEVLWKRQKDEPLPLVLPISQCLAHGLELFLKEALIRRGRSPTEVAKFRHDIYKMWMLKDFSDLRTHAQALAFACVGVKPQPYAAPNIKSIDDTIKELDHLYNKSSRYSLRYPNGEFKVPYPQPLLWVLAELVRDERWKSAASSE